MLSSNPCVIAALRNFAHVPTLYDGSTAAVYATCCGGKDDDKDGNYGYSRVFRQVKDISGNRNMVCEAFPVPLALPEKQRSDGNAVMATKLSDSNFNGELVERLERFIGRVRGA